MSDSTNALNIQYERGRDDCVPSGLQEAAKRRGCFCSSSNSIIKLIGASICIGGAVAIWTAQAEKMQGITEHYQKYYFLTYWIHSFYSVLYVAWKVWRIFPGNSSCNRVGDGKMEWSFLRLSLISGGLSFLSLVTGYLWYLSLPRTPIPANTAIYQSAAAFVFIISVPLLKERVTLLKVLCVLMSIGGVTLVSFFSNSKCHNVRPTNNHTHFDVSVSWSVDHPVPPQYDQLQAATCGKEKSTPLGYIFLLASLITYAVMKTSYKRFATVKGDPAALCNSVRMVGYFGVHTLLWMWPPLIALHYSGLEPFSWPTLDVLRLMVLNALMAVGFNGLIFISIALSSPLFVAVGTILTIPASVIVDWLVQKYLLPWQAFIGIGLIVLGFGGFASSEFFHAWEEQKHEASMKEQEDELPLNSSAASRESSPLLGPVSYKRNWRRTVIKYLF